MAENKNKNIPWNERFSLEWIGYLLFVSVLALVYIYLAHRTDNRVRDIDKVKKNLVELRAEHITLKSEIIQKSSRTNVEARLEAKGVKEPNRAVIKITAEDGEL